MRPTRQGRETPLRSGLVKVGIGVDPDAVTEDPSPPIDRASDALAFIPASLFIGEELVEGETVIGSGISNALSNANDRDYTTTSKRNSGVEGSTTSWWWGVDLGSAVEVTAMDADDPIGSDAWVTSYTVTIEHSDDGSSWTSTAYTYSTTTVSTGLSSPSPESTLRHHYEIDTPSSHRYWRIKQTVGAGFHSDSGMAEWFVYGVGSSGIEWIAALFTIDGDGTTFDYVFDDVITATGGPFWRATLADSYLIASLTADIGFEDAGSATVLLQGATASDYSDAVTVASITVTATGSYTSDDVDASWVPTNVYQYWQLVLDSAAQGVYVYEVHLYDPEEGGVTDHGDLTGRDAAEQHPADAVSLEDTAGWFEAIEVEGGLAELAAKVVGYQAHGSIGAAETFDSAIGWHSGTLDDDCTFTLTANPSGTVSSLFLELAQDGTGGWTVDLPASVVNASELEAAQDTTADATSLLVLLSRDGGTTWYGGWWGQATGGASALDDLTDVTITAPAEHDTLRYDGSEWINDSTRWEPVTFNFGSGPELVWDGDDLVMEWKGY